MTKHNLFFIDCSGLNVWAYRDSHFTFFYQLHSHSQISSLNVHTMYVEPFDQEAKVPVVVYVSTDGAELKRGQLD